MTLASLRPRISAPGEGHIDDLGFNESAPKTRPSELFQRNCWISFEPVESSIAVLADYIGPHKILWATDYPHQDGFFPGTPQMLRERLGCCPLRRGTRCWPAARSVSMA